MKKLFLIFAAAVVLSSLAFADKSRFYEGGKVIDTMYVDSEDGLRARDFPSLKSARLCALPHRLPVKVVAVGREETIDGITAPWVEILLPRYEWKGSEAEFGWVFGGYLSGEQKKFSTKNWKNKDYENYLLNFCSWQKEHDDYLFEIYVGFFDATNFSRTEYIDDEDGVWSVSEHSGDSFTLKLEYTKNEYYFDPDAPEAHRKVVYKTVEHKIKIIDEAHYFDETLNKNFYGLIDWASEMKVSFYLKDSNDSSFYDYVERIADTADAWHANQSVAIKCGVSAKGTEYERQYHDYWNPIMQEHQKKADEMK